MLLLALSACGRADPWTATREVCGVDVHPWSALGADIGSPAAPVAYLDEVPMDEACAQAIVSDFGGDAEELLAGNGGAATLTEHLAADLEDTSVATGLSMALLGGWWLLGDNAGTVGELAEDDWTDAAFVERMGETVESEDAPLAQALYDFAAGNIAGLAVDDRANPGIGQFGTLHLPAERDTTFATDLDPGAPLAMGTLLVHEARHRSLWHRGHVLCVGNVGEEIGQDSCDADLTGPHGFQAATYAAYVRHGACAGDWNVETAEELHWTYQINVAWPGSPGC